MTRLAFALVAVCSVSVAGQTATRNRVSLTVSGGISLGSYQAGATWAFLYVLRHQEALRARRLAANGSPTPSYPEPFELDVLTGASAGNINAILAAKEYCAKTPSRSPEASDLWFTWVRMG